MTESQREREESERRDRWIAEHARAEYNPPPASPREAMWAAIEERRRERAAVVPLISRAWVRWGLGLAAALAIGIGMGRWTRDPGTSTVATRPAAAPEARELAAARPDELVEPTNQSGALATAEPAGRAEPRLVRAARRDGPTPSDAPPATARDVGRRPVYRHAALQTLGQAEILITAYREDLQYGRVDGQIDRWARQTLASTRLLLDSPAGDDPELRPLLEDLELVLAQIVQLSGAAPVGARDEVDRTIEERELLPRLRKVAPGGSMITRALETPPRWFAALT
jgi:hypothetical protein